MSKTQIFSPFNIPFDKMLFMWMTTLHFLSLDAHIYHDLFKENVYPWS